MVIISEVDEVAVDVPLEVVPWKYIVPLPPLAAVIVVLPQKVPAPLPVTVVGNGLMVTVTLPSVPQQPDAVRALK